MIDSYSESSYLSDQFGQIYPPIKWWFHRLLLWHLISHFHSESSYLADQVLADLPPGSMIDSYSESSYLVDQVLADLPPGSNGNYRFLLWELIFGRPCVGRSTPLEWQFHRFLLWQLIFHSYSESSYLADQDGHIYPLPLHQTATIDCYSESSYLADQVLADLTPSHPSNGNYRFLLLELIFGRPSVGRSTPLNGNFPGSCSDSSYFISILRAHIWETSCGQIYPPSNGDFTDCCSNTSYFIPSLKAHIW